MCNHRQSYFTLEMLILAMLLAWTEVSAQRDADLQLGLKRPPLMRRNTDELTAMEKPKLSATYIRVGASARAPSLFGTGGLFR